MVSVFRSREGVTLLSLLPGSAKLLDDILSSTNLASDEVNFGDAVKALSDVGVHSLSPLQAREVLKHKISITS